MAAILTRPQCVILRITDSIWCILQPDIMMLHQEKSCIDIDRIIVAN